jgi:uncharacterized RDD family membrane protein YckC
MHVIETYESPSILRRFIAYAIDNVILCFIWAVLFFFIDFENVLIPFFLSISAMLILRPISEFLFGQTVGKIIVKLKVLNQDYKPINLFQAFIRFTFLFIEVAFFIGVIVALLNEKGRRIGDNIAKTLVVKITK